jgi:hypothetical protein
VRIRHYGLLANRVRAGNVARCRALLGVGQGSGAGGLAAPQGPQPGKQAQVQAPARCPVCGQGHMVVRGKFEPVRVEASPAEVPAVEAADTS